MGISAILMVLKKRNNEKEIRESFDESVANANKCLEMPLLELSSLSDSDLFFAISEKIDEKVYSFDKASEGIASLNDAQKLLFALNTFETEVNDGGLCQFFVNSSRAVAPFISEYFDKLGVDEHKALFDGFVTSNGIDLKDLESFSVASAEEFVNCKNRYPFGEYDDKFCQAKPIRQYLEAFVRANLEELNTLS